MPLQKQNFPIAFSQGIDTKVDKKQVVPGRLRTLENATFQTIGQLQKRNGYDSITKNVLDGDKYTGAKAVATFKDELLVLSDDSLYSYSSVMSKWINKGRVSKVFPESKPILRNIHTQSNIDAISVNNINVYAWEDSRGGIRYTVSDDNNNTSFIADAEVSSSGVKPHIAAISSIVFIFYIDGTDLKFRKLNPIDPTTLESEVTAVSDVDAVNNFDIETIGDEIYVAYESSVSGGTLAYFSVDIDDNISSVVSKTGESASACVNVSTDSASRFIATYSDGTDVKCNIYIFDFKSQVLAPTSVETVSSVVNVTTIQDGSNDYLTLYEISAAATKDHYIRKNTFDTAGSIGTAADVLRSVNLQSNLFKVGDTFYAMAGHASEFQSTYFLIDSAGLTYSKVSPGVGGTNRESSSLASVTSLGNSMYLIPSQIVSKVVAEDSDFFTAKGVQATIFDFDSDTNYQKVSIADNLIFSGGYLQSYDGFSVTEQGFHLFPEDLSQQANAASGGSISDGTYNYAAIYTWNDNQGLRHFSSPSLGFEATASAGGSSQTLTIRVPTLRVTDKSNVMLELFRTVDAGTIFHKVTTISSPVENDKTVDYIDIVDGVSDTTLIGNELLYTTGGILENASPASASLITSFSNRAMIVPSEQPNVLQYSKINSPGEPLEFSDLLQIPIGRDEEPVTAIATLDDKFILFKKTSMYFISGEGPNNTGAQDTFSQPEIISAELGCDEPDSIVLVPAGLMFKSNKGIYLLDRKLAATYIGSEVEEFNDKTITSAAVSPDTTQVRFTIADDSCLVYDHFVDQWSTFTNHRGLDAVNHDSVYHYLRPDGLVYSESSGSYLDGGTDIRMAIETSWLSLGGLQGYKRVYKLLGLGEYKSPHKLKVKAAYDFIEAFTQEKIIDTADFTDDNRYGQPTTSAYGDESPYGGEGNQYQFRVDLKKQKCESIKIRIEEIQESSNIGEGLSISGLTFQVGAKEGLNKVDDDQKFGTE